MKKALLIILLILNAALAFSEKVEGTILNKTSLNPLEYVNIGIPDKNTGTVSDSKGYFILELSIENINDSILISCIGYENSMLAIKDIISKKTRFFTYKKRHTH